MMLILYQTCFASPAASSLQIITFFVYLAFYHVSNVSFKTVFLFWLVSIVLIIDDHSLEADGSKWRKKNHFMNSSTFSEFPSQRFTSQTQFKHQIMNKFLLSNTNLFIKYWDELWQYHSLASIHFKYCQSFNVFRQKPFLFGFCVILQICSILTVLQFSFWLLYQFISPCSVFRWWCQASRFVISAVWCNLSHTHTFLVFSVYIASSNLSACVLLFV